MQVYSLYTSTHNACVRVDANSTFAWYQATSTGALSATAADPTNITASAGSHTFAGGALTFSAAFEAVSENSLPTWVDDDTDYFQNCELTNNNGYTYFTSPAGKNVVASDALGKTYGVAQVRFSLRNSTPAKPSADEVKDAYSAGTHDVSLWIRGTGHAKVLAASSAPEKASADNQDGGTTHKNEFTASSIQVTLTLNSDGTYGVQQSRGGAAAADVTEVTVETVKQAEWIVKFYYAIAPEYSGALDATGQSVDATDTHHSADTILVATSAS